MPKNNFTPYVCIYLITELLYYVQCSKSRWSGGCLCDFVQPWPVQCGSVLIVSAGESGLFSRDCDLERAVVKLKDENHRACAEMSNISHLSVFSISYRFP